jgi:hypothetical protein
MRSLLGSALTIADYVSPGMAIGGEDSPLHPSGFSRVDTNQLASLPSPKITSQSRYRSLLYSEHLFPDSNLRFSLSVVFRNRMRWNKGTEHLDKVFNDLCIRCQKLRIITAVVITEAVINELPQLRELDLIARSPTALGGVPWSKNDSP